jgi:hypothetical protein
MNDDPRINSVGLGPLIKNDDMHVIAALHERVCGIRRHALRAAGAEMRDDEGESFLLHAV